MLNEIYWKVEGGNTTQQRVIGTHQEARNMKAVVTHLNAKLGYYSATTDRNKVVFVLVDQVSVRLGDILEGDTEMLGVRSVHNETQGVDVRIDIKNVYALSSPFQGHGQ